MRRRQRWVVEGKLGTLGGKSFKTKQKTTNYYILSPHWAQVSYHQCNNTGGRLRFNYMLYQKGSESLQESCSWGNHKSLSLWSDWSSQWTMNQMYLTLIIWNHGLTPISSLHRSNSSCSVPLVSFSIQTSRLEMSLAWAPSENNKNEQTST